jgi:hypothetical protein
VLAFSDPEIIRLASDHYIPVAGDDWYQRRRDDPEGEFFRKVSRQAGKGGEDAAGGPTRQGIYCLTADGTLLAYRNAGNAPEVMKQVIRQGLAKWNQLPEDRRKPGAIAVPEPEKVDARYDRSPPKGALVIKVFTRVLRKDDAGKYQKGISKARGGDAAARDHLWLTEAEWRGLIPAEPKVGDTSTVPAGIAERIARYHLIDNTRGEPPMWNRQEVRNRQLTLTVEEVTADRFRLRLEGAMLLSSEADVEKSRRGYDARLLGYIGYDRKKNAIDRFDLVALGGHWGEGTFTRNALAGQTPLGVAFELARGDSATDLIPPQAARDPGTYFGTGR